MAGLSTRLLLRVARQPSVRLPLTRSVLPITTTRRNEGIFTKYREPPNGFLFNEKPLKPGEKRKWEDWEAVWYVGWGVSVLIVVLTVMFKPESGYIAEAKQEALRRIKELDAAENGAIVADETSRGG